MVDAIADGIIMVGAAGNDFTKIDVVGGTDYNNRFVSTFNYRYHEGSSPTSAAGCICVGAINSLVNEAKATFSNCGPRVDIYAPGVNIMSSLNIINSDWPGANDPRNATYKIGKAQGTSMASPQVCGVLACVLEVYPNLTPAKALEYLTTYSKKNQITNTGGSYTDYTSLQGSENRYLFYYKERKDSGSVFPKTNYLLRSSSKQAYPRPRIRRTA
jgi:subtilisin family serine protease